MMLPGGCTIAERSLDDRYEAAFFDARHDKAWMENMVRLPSNYEGRSEIVRSAEAGGRYSGPISPLARAVKYR